MLQDYKVILFEMKLLQALALHKANDFLFLPTLVDRRSKQFFEITVLWAPS